MKPNKSLAFLFLLMSFSSWGKAKFSREEVAQHATTSDCWMIVEKEVYDLSAYLPDHEKYTKALPDFCGKDATEAWNTKSEKQKPHSKKAGIVLKKYKVGDLKQ